MPGTNLTRDEAQTRASLISVESYTVDLDLSAPIDAGDTFASTTTLRFSCTDPGATTFADLVDATVHEITLNGTALDPATAYADSRITLSGLAAENELVVKADCTYSHSGEGLHRFVDPVDDRVYLYSQFEVPDARRVFTTFEQPDLKSVFTFNVTAPSSWVVVSNAPTPQPEDLGNGNSVWNFPETKKMSTYITAIVAGEYHAVFDTYEGKFGTIPLGHYCRQSLVEFLDRDELVKLTRQSFEFFEEQFDFPYPFEKYDQLYVPEYNMGAMENAGCVTLRDEYLPRSRQPRSFYEFRTSVITHEMAHMWFGDLVTMKWWDDLWLNESFAEWACYWCEAEATDFTDAWTGFANARKQTGYRADQLPSTHPIAADNHDLEAVEVNFDMITYAKGASVLKQLVAWVGLEPFVAGIRQYFKDHAYGNSEFSDLLSALEKSSGRELKTWATEWLQTAGVNTLAPSFELDADGAFASLRVKQTAHPDWPTLRRHRLGIGFYNKVDGKLVREDYLEVDVEGESTDITEAVGRRQPDLLLLNDQDLAYAKIRLDERSLATVTEGLASLEDSLARALCWGAAWDMTRDAEMAASDFVRLVLANIGTETDAWGVSRIPTYAAQSVNSLSAPANRAALSDQWEEGLRSLLASAEPASDHQLTFARSYAAAAHNASALDDLEALLDGSLTFDGLAVDQDLRWVLIGALARAGRFDEEQITAELARDNTISGQENAAAARAARPDAEAKAAAFKAAMLDGSTP
ncbi:MAG TPA: aminopeptidase N, partial [Nocardioides sp.]